MDDAAQIDPVGQIDATIGSMFIGTLIATALWGVTCVQTWFYFDNYRNDRWILKATVIATFLSDTIHQVIICEIVYTYLVSNFGNNDTLKKVLDTVYIEVLFNGFTGLFVQTFLTYRIWSFRKNIPLVLGIGILVAAEFAVSVAYMAQGLAWHLNTYQSLKRLRGLSMSINALAAAADITISASICTLLSSSRTGFAWSNHMINRLMLFSINTGILTSLFACLSLITILIFPDKLIYFCFYFIIGRLYANSLLATLNARRAIRNSQRSTPANDMHSLQEYSGSASRRRPGPSEIGRSPTGVQIQIETIRDYNQAGSITDSVNKENVDRLADDVESANSSARGSKTAPGLEATKDVQVVSFTTADRDRETR
ncbi:hypothetical protein VNI00_011027 [Paramarasmius palmivorus]|uniref:DUF6534 domain-containing protein n=1 Tax=Paramarasmius palmivorus TaxID=297713 RepID=A0AAW0CC35_9AGAR